MAMQKQVSPATAAIAVVLVLVVIGGIWWFVKGRGPAPINPADVERMLQQQNPSSPVAPPGGAPVPPGGRPAPATPSPR
jgi:hypothetical protein